MSSSLNASAVCQIPTVLATSIPVISSSKVLVADFYIVTTVIRMTPSSINMSLQLPTRFFVTIQFMSVRHLFKDGPTFTVLTVTPIDRLHDGDGSNGVKGAAEEEKLCKL